MVERRAGENDVVPLTREDVERLTDLRGRPSIVVGNDDVRRRGASAKQGENESERAHGVKSDDDEVLDRKDESEQR